MFEKKWRVLFVFLENGDKVLLSYYSGSNYCKVSINWAKSACERIYSQFLSYMYAIDYLNSFIADKLYRNVPLL